MKIHLKVVDFLARNMDKKLTINGVSKSTGEHYSFVHRTINKLAKDGVIKKEKAGKAYLCSLNFENEKTLILLQLSEIEKRNELYEKNGELRIILEDFVRSAEKQSGVASIVLFGSYSKGAASRGSDIDILLVSSKNFRAEKITKEMYAKYGKEINTIVMAQKDFRKQKDSALVKEIINNHHVLYGAEKFVGLLFR